MTRYVALDTETHLAAPAQPGIAAPPIVVWSIADGRGCHLIEPERGLVWFRKALLDPDLHLIGCNVVYDLVCATVADPSLLDLIILALEADRIHDVGIREALIDIGKGDLVDHGDEDGIGIRYGLKILTKRYLGIDISADKNGPDAYRKRYATLADTPIAKWPWRARVYPMRDVAFPLAIYHLQEGGVNLHREGFEVRAAFALQLMSVWGVRTSGPRVAALRTRCEAEDQKNMAVFRAAGIIRPDGTEDQKRLAQLVTAAYGGSPPLTPKGRVASDRDTLTESGQPLLELYGRAGKNDKYLSTYLPILEQAIDQPWNPQFNVLVATTRVSSNAQQFPQQGGVRECFEPRYGHVYISADYPGGELRTMAQRAINEVGFSKLAKVLNAGLDPHLTAAAGFINTTYEAIKARYDAGEAMAKALRDLGKIYMFGKGGGMGAGTMAFNAREGKKGETTKGPDGTIYTGTRFCLFLQRAQRCGERKEPIKVKGKVRMVCSACIEVAKELDEGWLRALPEQKALFDRSSQLHRGGKRTTVMIPGVGVKRGKCGYTQWLNTPFQGLLAAAMKGAMWKITVECYASWHRAGVLWGTRPVLNVHDELIAESPERIASDAGDRIAKIMSECLIELVPDLAAAVHVTPSLGRTMGKKAFGASKRGPDGKWTVGA